MRTAMRVFLALTVFGLVAGRAATADEVADAGRAMLQKHRTSVVTVKLVIRQHFSMSGMGSEQSESPAEVTGTVIDPSGLTVVSLTATDPASLYASMMGDDDTQGLKVESTVTDAKILQDDGTEVNAKVVLRDKDFDLAFVRPETKPGEQYAFVDFTQAAQPQLLDELVVLNRLGRIANRAYAASVERVESIIEKPRTFYVPGKDPSTADLGSPVFALDGRVVGIGLLRASSGGSRGGMMGMLSSQDSPMVVILPAADVLEAAKQAPSYEEAPAPEAPAAEPAATEGAEAAPSVTIPAPPGEGGGGAAPAPPAGGGPPAGAPAGAPESQG